jgi:siroheme synthase-like protein
MGIILPLSIETMDNRNTLFPLFLKLEDRRLLIIGGGKVGLEKLNAVLGNSPKTAIRLVSITISEEIKQLAKQYPNLTLIEKAYQSSDLDNTDIIIAAVDDPIISKQISDDARQRQILINVADKPELCDFYLSSVVQKGSLKIAISTNGKSPTIAKRLKEVINSMIPNEMENVLDNMQNIRQNMSGDFEEKVKHLNELTNVLVAKQINHENDNKPEHKRWQWIVAGCLVAFLILLIWNGISSYIPASAVTNKIKEITTQLDTRLFYMMLICGFLAQMADGSLGMGYGTISTTFLLAIGVPPAIVSSRVHSARVFSSGVSGYSHHRFGNINKKLFKALVVPGIIGAVIGAALATFGQKYAVYLRIPLSLYTIYLGYFIIRKAFAKKTNLDKVKRAGWLAAIGGFTDAFAGGGWGTLVTSTLMSKRKSPRYVIGSVCLAEFFVVLTSSITFFILLKDIPLLQIAGLIIGGLIAAPIAARLVGKLPLKTMFILVGALVIITSCNTLWGAIVKVLAH